LQFSREVAQDARHTVRLWARRPWQIGFAILALAIGIGANTGVFSVVNTLLLRSLPFQDPERLAYLSLDFQPLTTASGRFTNGAGRAHILLTPRYSNRSMST